VLLLDPHSNSFGLGGVRHVITLLMVLAAALVVFQGGGRRIFSVPLINLLLLLMVLQIGGSILWLLPGGRDPSYSFLGRGLNILSVLGGAAIALEPRCLAWVSRRYLMIFVPVSVIIVLLLTAHSFHLFMGGQRQVYHVEFVYAVSVLTYFATRSSSHMLKFGIAFLCILNGVLAGKSTFYLLAMLSLGCTYGLALLPRLQAMTRRLTRRARQAMLVLLTPGALGVALIALGLVAVIVIQRSTKYEYDPRRVAYALRWEQFTSSPLYGKLFVDTTDIGAYVHLFGVPSHNDLLDLMAEGGILGLLLFLIPVGSAILGSTARQIMTTSGPQLRFANYLWFFLIFYSVAAMGNPFLADPVLAAPIWFAVGALLMQNAQRRLRWQGS